MQVSAGPAWRWVDADGTVHYSDRPVPGATEVYLPDAATPAPIPQPSPAASQSAPVAAVPVEQSAQYSQLAISSPAPQATLWNIGGELTVDVIVGPRLQQGHRLGLIYDGTLLNLPPTSGTSFSISDVFRGQHTVQAVILDSRNAQVLRSAPVQFMVQQTSLLNPNNPRNPTRSN
jgi:hypothetical protein